MKNLEITNTLLEGIRPVAGDADIKWKIYHACDVVMHIGQHAYWKFHIPWCILGLGAGLEWAKGCVIS